VSRLAGYLTAGWALLFAAAHFAWAAGSTVLLGGEAVDGVAGWSAWYDLFTGVLCLVGALLAVAMARAPLRPGGRSLIVLGWLVMGLLALRGGVGLIQDGYALVAHGDVDSMAGYDLWFVVGAVLFAWASQVRSAALG
jgi:hypothetical protein